jgi:hypothetical protein
MWQTANDSDVVEVRKVERSDRFIPWINEKTLTAADNLLASEHETSGERITRFDNIPAVLKIDKEILVARHPVIGRGNGNALVTRKRVASDPDFDVIGSSDRFEPAESCDAGLDYLSGAFI